MENGWISTPFPTPSNQLLSEWFRTRKSLALVGVAVATTITAVPVLHVGHNAKTTRLIVSKPVSRNGSFRLIS